MQEAMQMEALLLKVQSGNFTQSSRLYGAHDRNPVSKQCLPDSIVVNGSDICHKHLHALLWLGFRFVSHKPMLLVASDDVDHDAICLTDGSLQNNIAMGCKAGP